MDTEGHKQTFTFSAASTLSGGNNSICWKSSSRRFSIFVNICNVLCKQMPAASQQIQHNCLASHNNNSNNTAIADTRLRPLSRAAPDGSGVYTLCVKSVLLLLGHFEYMSSLHCLLLAVICQHDVIHKPAVRNILQRRQRRNQPRCTHS